MANITDQFVTSFSELYIGNKNAIGTTDYTDADEVRGFFVGGKTPAVEATDAASIAAGTSTYVTLGGVNVYFVNNTITAIVLATADLISAEAMIAKGLVFLSAQVPLVMEIGTLSNEATVIDTPTFGEVYKGKLRGQLDGGQLDTQLYWAPRNFVHNLMRGYAEDGTPIVAGIKWRNQAVGGDSEFVVFDSFVSSFGIDTTFDDVAKVSSTLVVDGAEHFASMV